MNLMIVDDSNVIRTVIEKALKNRIIDITCSAKNGRQAIELFKMHTPDIVTMDITMPIMDGIETIKQLIAMKPEVQILVISALSDKATLLNAIKLGASGFLCKPFNDSDLIEAIEELIEED